MTPATTPRWIVDAMNVIGTRPDGWWKDRRGATVELVGQLEGWATAGGHRDVMVVFERPPKPPISSAIIQTAHAPRAGANSADDEIVRLVRAADRPGDITVVTSDATLADRVRRAGWEQLPILLVGRGVRHECRLRGLRLVSR